MIYTLTLNPAVDHTIYVDEINKQDVTRVNKTIKDAAGKGINVAKVLKTLHLDAVCLGYVAGANGKFIENELRIRDITFDFIEVDGETRENTKVIVTDEKRIIELNDVGPNIIDSKQEELIDKLDRLLRKDDILVISGSVPVGIKSTFYADIIERYMDVFTILDVSGETFIDSIKARPKVIKPNLYELEQYTNKTFKSDETIVSACKKLVEEGIEHVFVTLGKKGAIYVSKDNAYKVDIPFVDSKSTVGAGDSFLAGLVYGFHHKFSMEKILQYAASVGSASVISEGTAMVDPIEINDILYETTLKEL